MMENLRKYGIFIPLIFAALGANELITRQFWFDESLTLLNFALLPAEKIYFSYAIPNNHILYTYLLHWHYLAAPSGVAPDVWCRILSLAIAFGFIIFSYWSIRKTAYRILLAAFAATLPFAIYATSVRGYIAALFFSAFVLHFACEFARTGGVRAGILYFLSSLGCVAVLPSDIMVCAAAVVYAFPLCGKNFLRTKRFYLLALIPVAAFVLFWMPIYPQLYAASRLGEGWQSPWRVLGAVSATFAAVCPVPLLCSLPLVFIRKKWRIMDLRLAAFLIVVPLIFFTKAAPFPRVFFPFFGVFLAVLAQYFQTFLAVVRKNLRGKHKQVFAAISIAAVTVSALTSWIPASRSLLNRINGSDADDYFTPWYIRPEHTPAAAAETIAKLDYPVCYMSFNSDPWSVMFYSALRGVDMSKFVFDGPRGKTSSLPNNTLVILNVNEDSSVIEKRFQGVCRKLWQSSHHNILRFSGGH